MVSRAVRILVAGWALITIASGVALVAAGQVSGLFSAIVGVGVLLAVAFERVRYRFDPTPPGNPFQATDESFLDPTTRRRMRVYVNPSTGERRYHAES